MSKNNLHGQVFDGSSFTPVNPPPLTSLESPLAPQQPVTNTNNPSIFVSIPHFRDGKRCAATLQHLFASSAHPERIFVGIIEQTNDHEGDPSCLLEYCALMGHAMKFGAHEHEEEIARKGERQADRDRVMEGCPRVKDQIRIVKFHALGAKGPVYARSFIRKLLGNEDYCMEIDAATEFTPNWDTLAIQQWSMTQNEYAVLSTVPLSTHERDRIRTQGNSVAEEVPRQCSIKIGSEGVPLYETQADGKATGLQQPLLSYAPSSQFTFAKCHLETNVPHDPFAAQLLQTEHFPRYARMWTRGYDVYTPSANIVYSESVNLHPLHHKVGHGIDGERKWPPNDSERHAAHIRMKVLLGIHHGIGVNEASLLGGTAGGGSNGAGSSIGGKISTARANLGIYGVGRRRTLAQLLEFTGIALPVNDASEKHGNEGHSCTNLEWIPYDTSISPRANFFDGSGKADDLDLEPIFSLRSLADATVNGEYDHFGSPKRMLEFTNRESSSTSSGISYSFVFLLWIGGLYIWYAMFLGNTKNKKGGRKKMRSTKRKDKQPLAERTIKDV